MLPISASVERSASENLVRRFGGEMPTASSPHDGVKGAVFPEFGARAPCGFQKIANAAPHGGCMACLVEAIHAINELSIILSSTGRR